MIEVHFVGKEVTTEYMSYEELLKILPRHESYYKFPDTIKIDGEVFLGIDPYAEDVHGKQEFLLEYSKEALQDLQYTYAQEI